MSLSKYEPHQFPLPVFFVARLSSKSWIPHIIQSGVVTLHYLIFRMALDFLMINLIFIQQISKRQFVFISKMTILIKFSISWIKTFFFMPQTVKTNSWTSNVFENCILKVSPNTPSIVPNYQISPNYLSSITDRCSSWWFTLYKKSEI